MVRTPIATSGRALTTCLTAGLIYFWRGNRGTYQKKRGALRAKNTGAPVPVLRHRLYNLDIFDKPERLSSPS